LTAETNNHAVVVNALHTNHAAKEPCLEHIITTHKDDPVVKAHFKSKKKAVCENDDSAPSEGLGGS